MRVTVHGELLDLSKPMIRGMLALLALHNGTR
jgi:hypothetical protein